MGDISEYRGIVVVAGFLASFVLLSTLVYSTFAVSPAITNRELNVPDYVDVSNTIAYNYTDTFSFNMTNTTALTGTGVQDFGGWYMQEWWLKRGVRYTFLSKYARWGLFEWWWGDGTWFSSEGVEISSPSLFVTPPDRTLQSGQALSESKLDSDYANDLQLKYKVNFGDHEQDVWFFFDESKYSTPSEAWDMSELTGFWGITWDQTKTTYNAWEIIGMILFFQRSDVVDPFTRTLVYTPIFIGFAYIAFILILRMIGALFGGGA